MEVEIIVEKLNSRLDTQKTVLVNERKANRNHPNCREKKKIVGKTIKNKMTREILLEAVYVYLKLEEDEKG